MHYIVVLLSFFFTINSFALCGNSQIVLSANITDQTSEQAYIDERAPFSTGDVISVFEIASGQSVYLTSGFLEDDNAGNYYIEASNEQGQSINLYHDHETWHIEGLQGSYTTTSGTEIDLSTIKCSYDDLF